MALPTVSRDSDRRNGGVHVALPAVRACQDHAVNPDDETLRLPPGAQASGPDRLQQEVLIPPLCRLLRAALWAWLALGPLLWLLAGVTGHGFASPLVVLRRMLALLQPGLLFLLLPALVFPLAVALARRRWQLGAQMGLMLGGVSQLGLATVWAVMGLYAAMHLDDPWEALPWVFPPYLESFAARHPQIDVWTLNGVRDLRLHAKGGLVVRADGNEIADAQVQLVPCDGTPTAADLGGLVMPPAARCSARLSIRRGAVERVAWQFELPPGTSREALETHFTGWARAHRLDASFNGNALGAFEAEGRGRRWRVEIQRARNGETVLMVPRGGLHPPWPAPAGARD